MVAHDEGVVPPSAMGQALVCVQPPLNTHAGFPPLAATVHAARLALLLHATGLQSEPKAQLLATVPALHEAVELSPASALQVTPEQLPV